MKPSLSGIDHFHIFLLDENSIVSHQGTVKKINLKKYSINQCADMVFDRIIRRVKIAGRGLDLRIAELLLPLMSAFVMNLYIF